MWDLLIVPQKPVAASRCVGCWREFLFCILCLVSILPQITGERMLFGCNLFSASISPSLLKKFLVHLLIPPAIVNTRGVKDACSTCSILSSYCLRFSFSCLEWAASRLWCAWLGATGSKTLISKNALWSLYAGRSCHGVAWGQAGKVLNYDWPGGWWGGGVAPQCNSWVVFSLKYGAPQDTGDALNHCWCRWFWCSL